MKLRLVSDSERRESMSERVREVKRLRYWNRDRSEVIEDKEEYVYGCSILDVEKWMYGEWKRDEKKYMEASDSWSEDGWGIVYDVDYKREVVLFGSDSREGKGEKEWVELDRIKVVWGRGNSREKVVESGERLRGLVEKWGEEREERKW